MKRTRRIYAGKLEETNFSDGSWRIVHGRCTNERMNLPARSLARARALVSSTVAAAAADGRRILLAISCEMSSRARRRDVNIP